MFVLKDINQMPRPYVKTFTHHPARFEYTGKLAEAQKFDTADRALSALIGWTWQAGRDSSGYATGLRPVAVEQQGWREVGDA